MTRTVPCELSDFETLGDFDTSAGKPSVPHGLLELETSEGLNTSAGKLPVPHGLQEFETSDGDASVGSRLLGQELETSDGLDTSVLGRTWTVPLWATGA